MNSISRHKALKLLSLFLFIPSAVSAQAVPPRKDIPAIAKAANGAIVTIITAANDKPLAQGTGFLVSADGVIVTNYHVIENGNLAIVKFPDDTAFPVDGVLASDKVRDLAIIKIHGRAFRTLELGDSDDIQVGEEVVAIGNPLSLESTVSNGIISGVRTSKELGKFLQTTAPISPGSSGGPLFNMRGEVVGINTLYLEGGENLNFAIPVNDAKNLLQNRSAKLRELPNESPAPAPSSSETRHGSLAEQKACGDQVKLLSESEEESNQKSVFHTMYASHFDSASGVCYMITKRPHYSTCTGKCAWVYIHGIKDAFEDRIVGLYSETYIHSEKGGDERAGGAFCLISPLGQQEITCKSEEEFNALAVKYFGITP